MHQNRYITLSILATVLRRVFFKSFENSRKFPPGKNPKH